MKKVKVVRNFVIKYKIPIIILLAVIIIAISTLVGTKGVVTGVNMESAGEEIIINDDGSVVVERGTEISGSARALNSDSYMELCVAGEWVEFADVDWNHLPVGEYEYRVVTTNGFGNLSYKDAKPLTISQKVVDVTIDQDKVVYGETPYNENVKLELVGDDYISDVKYNFAPLNKDNVTRTNVVVASITILDKNGNDVTEFYSLNFIARDMDYLPRELKFKLNDQSKIYDGAPLTNDEYTLIDSRFVDSDTALILDYSGSQTEVGKSPSTINKESKPILKVGDIDVTPLYNVSYVDGELEVTKRHLTITSNSATKQYDGTPLYDLGFTCEDELAEGDTLVVTSHTEITNVFESNQLNILDYAVYDKNGVEVTKNYEIEKRVGKLVIEPYKITVTATNKEAIYTGSSITNDLYTTSDLLEGTSVQATISGEREDVGTATLSVASWKVLDSTSKEVDARNFEVTTVDGTLTITPRRIVIYTENKTKEYDGTPLVNYEYLVEVNDELGYMSLPEGQTIVAANNTQITNVKYDEEGNITTINNDILALQIKRGDVDKTENYEISYKPGTLEITKKLLTITANNHTIVYGEEKANNGVSYEGFIEGESAETEGLLIGTLEYSYTYDETDPEKRSVGTYEITVSGLTALNYEIIAEKGTLEVIKRKISLYTDPVEKVYDGTPLVNYDYKYHLDTENDVLTNRTFGLAFDHVLNVVNNSTITNVLRGDEYDVLTINNDVNVEDIKVLEGETDITSNYDISYEAGTLKINPKALVVTVNDEQIVYGEAEPNYSVVYVGFIDGESEDTEGIFGETTLTYTTPYKTDDSDNRNVGDYYIEASGLLSNNYDITFERGNLKVIARSITITSSDDTKVYDGTPLTNSNYVVVLNNLDDENCLAYDDELVLDITGTITRITVVDDVINNSVENVFTYTITTPVEENYEVTVVYGTLTLNKREITITTNTNSWTYDGLDHYDNGNTITGGSLPTYLDDEEQEQLLDRVFVDIETATTHIKDVYRVNGEVAAIDNEQVVKMINIDESDVSDCYQITYVYGTLKIELRPLTITADSYEIVYGEDEPEYIVQYGLDGNEEDGFVNGETWEDLDGELLLTCAYDVTDSNNRNVGEYDIIPSGFTSNNYDIRYVNGLLTVSPRKVTITSRSAEKVYDGITLVMHEYDAVATNDGLTDTTAFVFSDSVELTYLNSIKRITLVNEEEMNSVDNEFTYIITTSIEENYEVEVVYGTLTINKREITITTNTNSWTYDGLDHYDNGNTITSGSIPTYIDEFEQAQPFDSIVVNPATEGATTHITNVKRENGEAVTVDNIQNAKIINNEDSADVTLCYEITYVNGTLTVNPAPLTIEANSYTITYGEDIDHNREDVEYHGFVNGETVESERTRGLLTGTLAYSYSYSRDDADHRDVGSYTITPSGLVANNYDITFEDGTLTVSKAPLVVTPNNITLIYGEAIPAYDVDEDVVTFVGFIEDYEDNRENQLIGNAIFVHEYDVTNPAKRIVKRDGLGNIISYSINIDNNSYTAKNYAIEYHEGALTVNPKPLNITAHDYQIVYGEAKPAFAVTYTDSQGNEANAFVYNETHNDLDGALVFSCDYNTANSEDRNVGTYDITPSGYTSNNYDIAYYDGELVVVARKVTITSRNATKVYDATSLTKHEFDAVATNEGLLDTTAFVFDDTVELTYSGAITRFGTVNNAFTYEITTADQDNYDVTVNYGTLEITKRPITLTSSDQDKVYDGQYIYNKLFTITSGTIPQDGLGNDYDKINIVDWTQFKDVYLVDGVVTAKANVLTYSFVTNDMFEEDVSDCYELTTVNGELIIYQKPLFITADNQTTVYGEVAPDFTVSYTDDGTNGTGFVEGENQSKLTGVVRCTCDYDTSVIAKRGVGNYVIIPSGATSTNYAITYVNGTLTITKARLFVYADDVSVVYGESVQPNGVRFFGFVYEEDNQTTALTGSANFVFSGYDPDDPAKRNVGDYDIIVSGFDSDNYNIIYDYLVDAKRQGVLTIIPRNITITSGSAEKEYDATPLTKDTFTAVTTNGTNGAMGYAEDVLTVTCNGTITRITIVNDEESNSVNNSFTYTITTPNANNYNVTKVEGTLQINKRAITIRTATNEWVYDSLEHYDNTNELEPGSSIPTYLDNEDHEQPFDYINVNPAGFTTHIKDVNRLNGVVKPVLNVQNAKIYSYSDSADVTCCYDITYHEGTLTVTPTSLTITADSKTIVYGEAAPLFTVSYDGFVGTEGENDLDVKPVLTCSYDIEDPTHRGVGNYEITVTDAYDNNYNITMVSDTLTVIQRRIELYTENSEKVYDGTALTNHNYLYQVDTNNPNIALRTFNKAFDHELRVVNNSSITNVKRNELNRNIIESINNEVVSIAFYEGETDVTANYNINYTPGTLTIYPAPLTVIGKANSVIYGDAIPTYYGEYSGFVNGENVSVIEGELGLSCSYRNPDNQANRIVGEYVISLDEESIVANDYNITFNQTGKLVVNKKELTIIADNKSVTYGDAIPAFTATDNGYVYGEDRSALSGELAFTCSYRNPDVTANRNAGTYDITPYGYSSSNYDIKYTPAGTLTVNKATLTITAKDWIIYYGDALPDDYDELGRCNYSGFKYSDTEATIEDSFPDVRFSYPDLEYETGTQIIKIGDYEIDINDYEEADNYEFSYNTGTLHVIPRTLYVTTKEQTITYGDADPTGSLTLDDVVFTNVDGSEELAFATGQGPQNLTGILVFTTTYDPENPLMRGAGTYPISISGLSSDDYDIIFNNSDGLLQNVEVGQLIVEKKEIIVKPNDHTITYGDARSNNGVTATGLVYGETISALTEEIAGNAKFAYTYDETDSTKRDVGNYDITLVEGSYSSDNYEIDYSKKGTLTVEKRYIRITSGSDTKVYDATPLTCNSATFARVNKDNTEVLVGSALVYGDTISVTCTGSLAVYKDGGESNTFDYEFTNGKATNYQVFKQEGTLTITKKTFYVRPIDPEVTYNGEIQYTRAIDQGDLVAGDTLADYETLVKERNAGVYPNNKVIDILITNAQYGDVTNCYNIDDEYNNNTFTINKRDISIRARGSSYNDGLSIYNDYYYIWYNGADQEIDYSFTVFDGSLADNQRIDEDTVFIKTILTVRNVGTYNLVLHDPEDIVILDSEDQNVTSNYNITTFNGRLEMYQYEIAIKAVDITLDYVGQTIDKAYYESLGDDGWEYYEGSQHLIEGHYLVPYYTDEEGNDFSFSQPGDKYVTLDSTVYNAELDRYVYRTRVYDAEDNDVTENYLFYHRSYTVPGRVRFNANRIVLTTNDMEKTYDGKPFAPEEFRYDYKVYDVDDNEITLQPGERIVIVSWDKATHVSVAGQNHYNNCEWVVLDAFDNEVTNYNLDSEFGTFVINKREITIRTGSDTKVFDGTALYCEDYEIVSGSLPVDEFDNPLDEIIIEANTSIVNVSESGTENNVIRFIIRDISTSAERYTTNYSEAYNITFEYGDLSVTAHPITISTNGVTKVYDGIAFQDKGFSFDVDGAAIIHDLNFTPEVKGFKSFVNVCDTVNDVDVENIKIYNIKNVDMTDNFNFSYDWGKVIITPRVLTLDISDIEKDYDGIQAEVEITSHNLIDGHHLVDGVIVDSGNLVNVTIDNEEEEGTKEYYTRKFTLTNFRIYDSEDNDVTSNYDISGLYQGDITIYPLPLEIVFNDIEGNYNHNSYRGAVDPDVTGLLDGANHTVTCTLVDSGNFIHVTRDEEKQAGTKAYYTRNYTATNIRVLDESQNDITNNYVITTTGQAKITIYPVEITISMYDFQKAYDGIAYFNYDTSLYEITSGELLDGDMMTNELYGYWEVKPGSYPGMFSMIDYNIVHNESEDVTVDYEVEIVNGNLTITGQERPQGNGGSSDGEGGGDGDILGGGSGDISTNGIKRTPPFPMFDIMSNYSGYIYLRGRSYGDYNGKGFNKGYLRSNVNPNYNSLEFASYAIDSSEYYVTIYREGSIYDSYLVPYFTTDSYKYFGDDYVAGDYSDDYTINFKADNLDRVTFDTIGDVAVSEEELAYRAFVLANYLSTDGMSSDLMAYYDEIIATYGLDKNDPYVYVKVNSYIQSAAVYDYDFYIPKDCEDYIYYFLTEGRRGVCQHYAMSAVMLYRYLGIPARYVTGFAASAVADTKTSVMNTQAHAWVEVYINGFGWVPMEVTGYAENDMVYFDVSFEEQADTYTGSPFAFDFSEPVVHCYDSYGNEIEMPDGYQVVTELKPGVILGTNPDDYVLSASDYIAYVEDEEGNKIDFYDSTITKHDASYTITENGEKIEIKIGVKAHSAFEYDGTSHSLPDDWVEVISGELRSGDYIEAKVYGGRTNPGSTPATLNMRNVVIRNRNGDNVTFLYDIDEELVAGSIVVNAPSRITITSIYSGPFDGASHHATPSITNGTLNEEYFTFTSTPSSAERTVVGRTDVLVNDITYDIICKATGLSVKNVFVEAGSVNVRAGYIEIVSVSITIAAASKTWQYDGTTHSSDEYEIVNGSLLEGHYIVVENSGSITQVGQANNSLNRVRIYDEYDNDVTASYNIITRDGTLTVTKASIKLTAKNRSVYYNGSPVEDDNSRFSYTAGYNGFFNGKLSITLTIRQQYRDSHPENMSMAGTTKLQIVENSVVIRYNEVDITNCFDLEAVGVFNDGTLTIKKRSISLKPEDLYFPYSGREYTESDLSIDSGTYDLEGNDRIFYCEFEHVSITNIGQVETSIREGSVIIYNERDENVTSCYDIDTSETGVIEIY